MNILFMLHPKSTVDFLYDDETMRRGLSKLRKCGYTALPVITRDGIYVGTVSEGDFLRVMLENNLYSADAQEDYVMEPAAACDRSYGRASSSGNGSELSPYCR